MACWWRSRRAVTHASRVSGVSSAAAFQGCKGGCGRRLIGVSDTREALYFGWVWVKVGIGMKTLPGYR